MTTSLITSIICLIVLGSSAGAYFIGRHISSIQQRNDLLETTYAKAEKHIEELEDLVQELAQENEHIKREQASTRPTTPMNSWDPSDPLNSQAR